MGSGVASQDEVSERWMKFPEFSTLWNGPTTLTTRQSRFILFWLRLDVQQELDNVPESIQLEQLLTLANTLKL
jgi:hypothetical protein